MLPSNWPRWIILPIGFLLVAAVTGLGLGLVMAVQAAAPGAVAGPTPTSVYEESAESPGSLAYAHAQEGLECLDCHVWDQAVPMGTALQSPTKMEFCFDCHVDNEHTSYAEVSERTAGYVVADELVNPNDDVVEDQNINPHDPHPGLGLDPIQCSGCHLMHGESPLLEGCFTCHHQRNLVSCNSVDCHAE